MQRLLSWPKGLFALSLKKKLGLAFAIGALMTLALPPVYLYPAVMLAFPLSAWVISAAESKKQAFWSGWMIGFSYLAFSLYWISHALTVFSSDFWWMVPFAALGLPAFFGLYTGLAGLGAYYFKTPVFRIAAWGGGWLLAEWLRGTLFTGFPWNLIGQSWGFTNEMSQMAAYLGIYGMSGLVILSLIFLALLPFVQRNAKYILVIGFLFISLGSYGLGSYRLNNSSDLVDTTVSESHGMRLVQSGIPQREKWAREFQRRNFEKFLSLSLKDRPEWVRTIIWPETAAAFFLDESELALRTIGNILPDGGHLLTGAPRREGGKDYKLYNSMLAIDKSGKVVNSYDKSHLVPFGEYVPLKDWLPIQKITAGATDYSAGSGPRSLTIGGLPMVGPLICYEIIFSGAAINEAQPPKWLLNLTNDGWYGKTAGPHQHLEITRIRAIEQGIPVVRAANTGMSAIIDPFGRIIDRLSLNEEGVIDFILPKSLAEPTLFQTIGNGFFFLLIGLWGAVLIGCSRLHKSGPKPA